ncbi:exodeoxyribonuclease VII small subunit [Nitrosophilus kaiyonis]|uniref:exodeoxyribonuclease VII small subunit n=1 Tax=Nitrosophilus kaiyonis TaxID=2930200 RepID=UPI0024907061|nr:exodeoxyribonuclease VII small subunit [Nitrosophilus kaiyonis]
MKSSDFEKKIEDAKKVLEKLMNPEITLSDSVKLYKEGLKALKEAQEMLEKAKVEIEEIEKNTQNSDISDMEK